MLIKDINNTAAALLDIDPYTGQDKRVRGQRLKTNPVDDAPLLNKEVLKQLITEVKVKEHENKAR